MTGLLVNALLVVAAVATLAVVVPIALALLYMVIDMVRSLKNPGSRFDKFI